ncbi:MAG: polyprenyl diphosphate synthase [Byssovorax sp.]
MNNPTLPRHIAIILDGNGRWAAQRGLPRTAGHEQGASAVRLAVRSCCDRGIETLTLYAFSVNNWSRPKDEVDALMRICTEFADGEREDLVRRGVRVQIVGELDDVPTKTRRSMDRLVEETASGTKMTLALALNYGGRRDMVNAMRALAVRARAGLVIPEEITEESLRSYLTTSPLPDPDLIIRTGGERRLSDFLLFECAYAELYFAEEFWPDFSEATLDDAIAAYGRRQRRYGRTSAQLAAG